MQHVTFATSLFPFGMTPLRSTQEVTLLMVHSFTMQTSILWDRRPTLCSIVSHWRMHRRVPIFGQYTHCFREQPGARPVWTRVFICLGWTAKSYRQCMFSCLFVLKKLSNYFRQWPEYLTLPLAKDDRPSFSRSSGAFGVITPFYFSRSRSDFDVPPLPKVVTCSFPTAGGSDMSSCAHLLSACPLSWNVSLCLWPIL